MILKNFLYRIADYLSRNRARLIKSLLWAAAAVALVALILYGAERLQQWKLEKKTAALESEIRDASARAKEAERQAEALKNAIEAKYGELRAIRERAETAESRLRKAKTKTITLKEEYETIRYLPMPDATCADACRALAGLGYACK